MINCYKLCQVWAASIKSPEALIKSLHQEPCSALGWYISWARPWAALRRADP